MPNENTLIYVENNNQFMLNVYDIVKKKEKLIYQLKGTGYKYKILNNENIAVMGNDKLIIFENTSFKVLKEVKCPNYLRSYPIVSHKGDKLAYIGVNGLYISDIDFRNSVRIFTTEFYIGKTKFLENFGSFDWSRDDKKIIYGIGFGDYPVGIGIVNSDGTDNKNFFTNSYNYDVFLDGSILHDNYVINTSVKEIGSLPNKLIELTNGKYSTDTYSNCSPNLKRLLHIKREDFAGYIKSDFGSILDFSDKTEYILPGDYSDEFNSHTHFVAWSPSSNSFIYSLISYGKETNGKTKYYLANIG